MNMICGNTQAELDNDTQTEAQEIAQAKWDNKRWNLCVLLLLEGKKIHENGRIYSLQERLVDEFDEFAEMFDLDYDFMNLYANGKLDEKVRELIESQARTLASVIVGE